MDSTQKKRIVIRLPCLCQDCMSALFQTGWFGSDPTSYFRFFQQSCQDLKICHHSTIDPSQLLAWLSLRGNDCLSYWYLTRRWWKMIWFSICTCNFMEIVCLFGYECSTMIVFDLLVKCVVCQTENIPQSFTGAMKCIVYQIMFLS